MINEYIAKNYRGVARGGGGGVRGGLDPPPPLVKILTKTIVFFMYREPKNWHCIVILPQKTKYEDSTKKY